MRDGRTNMNKEIMNIKVESIFPNTYQPRKFFNEEALNELSQSIIEHGIIQPITVRRMGDKFELVAGERRWRAARKAHKFILVVVFPTPPF